MSKNIWDFNRDATESLVGKLSELIVEKARNNLSEAFCDALYDIIDNEIFFMINQTKEYLQIYADIGGHEKGTGIPLYDLKNEIDKYTCMLENHEDHPHQRCDNEDMIIKPLIKLRKVFEQSLKAIDETIEKAKAWPINQEICDE